MCISGLPCSASFAGEISGIHRHLASPLINSSYARSCSCCSSLPTRRSELGVSSCARAVEPRRGPPFFLSDGAVFPFVSRSAQGRPQQHLGEPRVHRPSCSAVGVVFAARVILPPPELFPTGRAWPSWTGRGRVVRGYVKSTHRPCFWLQRQRVRTIPCVLF